MVSGFIMTIPWTIKRVVLEEKHSHINVVLPILITLSKLQVSVRDKEDQMIAFADSDNSPVILLNRNDIEDDKSAKDSATGMVQRNGKWEIQE